MKKTISTLLFAAAVVAGNYSYGQTTQTTANSQDIVYSGSPTFSVGVNAGVPVGNFTNIANFATGVDLKLAIPVSTGTDITLNGGYNYFFHRNNELAPRNSETVVIPAKAGLRFRFAPRGLYLEPNAGYASVNTRGASENTGGFVYGANLGWFISNHFDIAAQFQEVTRNASKGDNLASVGLRLAYNFRPQKANR